MQLSEWKDMKYHHLLTKHSNLYLVSCHLRAVDVTDGVQQVVCFINDDNASCEVNATCLASVLMQESVVRDHYYLYKYSVT